MCCDWFVLCCKEVKSVDFVSLLIILCCVMSLFCVSVVLLCCREDKVLIPHSTNFLCCQVIPLLCLCCETCVVELQGG